MSAPTPETNLLIGELVQNSGFNWTTAEVQRLGEHAIRLKRERDEARQQIHDWIASDKRTAELNQLRKVVDELANVLINHTVCLCVNERGEECKTAKALADYDELPHVKAKEQR